MHTFRRIMSLLAVIAMLSLSLATAAPASTYTASTGGQNLLQPSGKFVPAWGWPGYYVTNVTTYTDALCGISQIGYTSGPGPATLELRINTGVSATYNASVSISPSIISAGVGFNVTSSYTVTDVYTIWVPAGHVYDIIAYPLYDEATFDIMYNPVVGAPYKVGWGYALHPSGVCFDWNDI